MRIATDQELSKEVVTLCIDEFRTNFVPYNVKSFIEEIYLECEKEGILRTPGEPLAAGKETAHMEVNMPRLAEDKLRELISKNDLESAF